MYHRMCRKNCSKSNKWDKLWRSHTTFTQHAMRSNDPVWRSHTTFTQHALRSNDPVWRSHTSFTQHALRSNDPVWRFWYRDLLIFVFLLFFTRRSLKLWSQPFQSSTTGMHSNPGLQQITIFIYLYMYWGAGRPCADRLPKSSEGLVQAVSGDFCE